MAMMRMRMRLERMWIVITFIIIIFSKQIMMFAIQVGNIMGVMLMMVRKRRRMMMMMMTIMQDRRSREWF